MTESPIEPMTPAEPTEDSVVADDDTSVPETLEQARKLRQENKSLRTRLRTAETDLEAAVTRLAAAQHAEVERLAAETLLDPTDVWRQQPDMVALLDDEYQSVDPAKVAEVAQQLVTEKPHLARPQNTPPPTDRPIESLRGGASPDVTLSTPSWQSFIRGHSGQHG